MMTLMSESNTLVMPNPPFDHLGLVQQCSNLACAVNRTQLTFKSCIVSRHLTIRDLRAGWLVP